MTAFMNGSGCLDTKNMVGINVINAELLGITKIFPEFSMSNLRGGIQPPLRHPLTPLVGVAVDDLIPLLHFVAKATL